MSALFRTSVLLLIALIAACGGAEDRKTVYYNKGKELFVAGNYEKARVEYQNALQIEPKDVEVRFALAQTLEKLDSWQGAARQYLAIIKQDENHIGALLNLGRLYLLSNNDDQARENAERILGIDPQHTAAATLLAGVEAKAGNRERARALTEQVLEREPNHPEAASLLASVLVFGNETEAGLNVLRDAVAAHPEQAGLRINLARVYARAGQADEAVAELETVVAKAPDRLAYRNTLARLLISLRRIDAAEAVYRQAIEDFPEQRDAQLAYIEFLTGTRGVEAAVRELRVMIERDPTERQFQFALGKIFEATQAYDDAATVYEGVIAGLETGPDLLTAKTRLAVVRTRQQRLHEARELVDEVLLENARDVDALTLRGTLMLNDGDLTGAIADLRTVLRDAPERVAAVRLLSRAHQGNGETALARDVLEQGFSNNPDAAVLGLDLANFHAGQGDLDGALRALDTTLARQPESLPAMEGKIRILTHRREFAAALEVAQAMKQVRPDDARGYHLAGVLRRANGDAAASLAEFDEALARDPDSARALSELVKTLLGLERREEAESRVDSVVAERPESGAAPNLRGELHLARGEYEQAESMFRRAIESRPDWAIPYRNLATVLVTTERREAAVELMREGIEATGGSALLLTALAAYYEQSGNLDAAIEEYERVLEERPDSALTLNNLAMLLAEYKTDQASLERARELVRPLRNTRQPAFLDTIGWIEYRLGAYEQARLFIEQAVEAAPDAHLLHYHLGMVHHAAGNQVGAREHLERALQADIAFKGAGEARAALDAIEAATTGPD